MYLLKLVNFYLESRFTKLTKIFVVEIEFSKTTLRENLKKPAIFNVSKRNWTTQIFIYTHYKLVIVMNKNTLI